VAQGVADRLGEAGFARDPLELGRQPGPQRIDDRAAVLVAGGEARFGRAAADLGLDGIEPGDAPQRLVGDRRRPALGQLEEPAPGIHHPNAIHRLGFTTVRSFAGQGFARPRRARRPT